MVERRRATPTGWRCAGASSTLLDEQAHLERMARIIGKDALPARQQLTLLCADLVNEGFLRQSAFSQIDRYCCPARQAAMMRLLGRFIDLAEAALAAGVAPERDRRACRSLRPLQRMGEEIGDDDLRALAAAATRRSTASSTRCTPARPRKPRC